MKWIVETALIIIASLSYSTSVCQSNTRVIAKLKDLDAGTVVYLSPIKSSADKDSVVAGKGKFQFNLSLAEGDLYFLQVGHDASVPEASMFLYLEPGILEINGNGRLLSNADLSGSKFAIEQNDLNKYIRNATSLKDLEKVTGDFFEAAKANDTARIAVLRPKYLELDSIRTSLYRKWVASHPASPVSAMVLSLYARESNMNKLQELLDQLQPAAKQNALAKEMQHSIDASRATAIGKVAPDFVQNDTSGRPVALKDFRGKYVLVDFWASWCVPCRAENPHLVKAYNNLKDKNFTVLSVSLDRPGAKDRWLKAIEEDKLTWTHVSDLKFWDNKVSKLYDIRSIPHNLLIGPNGVILAKNLRGENLEEKLRAYIK